jgi:MSHA biogenesis protein MshQ
VPAVSGTAGTFTNGVATGTAFAWPEVGIVKLVPHVADGNYLGAGDVVGSATGNVGRFVPNSLAVALNTPVFSTTCIAGGYTYLGQPFTFAVAPVITVTALALGGATTQNYTGSLFRLTNTSLTGRTYTPTPASPALDSSGLPATTSDPTIVDLGGGQGTLTFGAGTGIAFARGNAIAPFSANIALSINVIDSDGVAAAGNPVTFGAGSGISFNAGATQRYGRLSLRSRVGSELLDLPMSLTTEYYASAALGFTTNTNDSCSVAPALAFSGYQANLSAGETCVRDSGSPGLSGVGCAIASGAYRSSALLGDFNLVLAAPGSGNNGAVTVTVTAPSWLKYLWNASSGTPSNPSGLAVFGLFPGPASRIYQREVY